MITKEKNMQRQTRRHLPLRVAAVVLGAFVALFGLLGVVESTQAAADSGGTIRQDVDAAHGGDGGGGSRFYGILTAAPPTTPENYVDGPWKIDGQVYTATANTEFNTDAELFKLDGCVKVELVMGSTTEMRMIKAVPLYDCQGEAESDGPEIYGIVTMTPTTALIGTWTISDTVYTTTETTKFESEYGPLELGACVEAHLTSDGTNTVTKLESKPAYKCNRSEDDGDGNGDDSTGVPIIGKGEFWGTIAEGGLPEGYPDNLSGTWMLEGLTVPIVADDRTEFRQEKDAFDEGVLIKVEFVVLSDGTFLAREIRSALSPWFGDHEEDDYHHWGYKREAHAFGVIDNIADNVDGDGEIWTIGGISYTVTSRTKLYSRGITFEQGVKVRVAYKIDAYNKRIAKEIVAKRIGNGYNSDETGELYGFVTDRPNNSYIGTWSIGSLDCEAERTTRFEEEHGTLDGSPFVEVKYAMQDGNCLITKLETHVPPGGGGRDFAGPIENIDDMGEIGSAAANATVTIGGQQFTVVAATQMSGSLDENTLVVVNSFTDAAGSQVATRITAVDAASSVYIPLLTR